METKTGAKASQDNLSWNEDMEHATARVETDVCEALGASTASDTPEGEQPHDRIVIPDPLADFDDTDDGQEHDD